MPENNLPKNRAEYEILYEEINKKWDTKLKSQGVKMPGINSAKSFWLVALYSEISKPLSNNVIYNWMIEIQPDLFKNLKSDQQIRHLGTQDGWHILKFGDEYLDEYGNSKKLNGDYILVSIEEKSPGFVKDRRKANVDVKTFEELKKSSNNRCATCWHQENDKHPINNSVIKLQKGHMNPNKDLTLDNLIPQCQYCNQTYKADFIFGKDGRIRGINTLDLFFKMDLEKLEKELKTKKIPKKIKEVLLIYIKN